MFLTFHFLSPLFYLSIHLTRPLLGLCSSLLSSQTPISQWWGWSLHSSARTTLSGSSLAFRARWTADMTCTKPTRWRSTPWRPSRWELRDVFGPWWSSLWFHSYTIIVSVKHGQSLAIDYSSGLTRPKCNRTSQLVQTRHTEWVQTKHKHATSTHFKAKKQGFNRSYTVLPESGMTMPGGISASKQRDTWRYVADVLLDQILAHLNCRYLLYIYMLYYIY